MLNRDKNELDSNALVYIASIIGSPIGISDTSFLFYVEKKQKETFFKLLFRRDQRIP